jgi:NAD(P)-dependent dehydrogenase (short-subunit alcohol dehydrogenase family)
VRCLQVDVGDRAQLRAAAEETLRAFGRVHVLCNNAGVGGGGDTSDPDFDAWDRALRVNLGGVVNGTKIFAPLILAHGEGGHIVNTSSMAGIVPLPTPGLGAYQTAKFAVRGFTESLRMTLAPHGIGVSCLFPGGPGARNSRPDGAPARRPCARCRSRTDGEHDPALVDADSTARIQGSSSVGSEPKSGSAFTRSKCASSCASAWRHGRPAGSCRPQGTTDT